MNIKLIVVGGVVLVVLIGGYFGWKYWTKGDVSGVEAPQSGEQVQAQEIKVGEGDIAEPNLQVSVLYEGKLQDGTVFDSSAAHGNQPLVFVLGAEGIVPGFQVGVKGMREGGQRIFVIPPSLAYGAQEVKDASGKVVIPANSTLTFIVQLLDVSTPVVP
ncbi:MAG TPA: FKBP-type peptidyl-prolyl cis-trans isomerase [Candidatus Paceibacterota bacterium]